LPIFALDKTARKGLYLQKGLWNAKHFQPQPPLIAKIEAKGRKGTTRMTMLEDSREPEPVRGLPYHEPEVREAEENLRVIRELMERSTKYSTFSGLSGILAGAYSIVGCLVTYMFNQRPAYADSFRVPFLITWSAVIALAIGTDYLLMKRRAARVGKRIVSRLGKQMVYAAGPGLGAGALLTLWLVQHSMLSDVYSIWMLCYGIAVCAVGQFSQREVKFLGVAFLLAGALTLLVPPLGLPMMALAFGGFHIVYALVISRKDGW
jgi:hypothetical protein